MKQKIMQVLFSADNELTTDEIQWAVNNIPNTTTEDTVPYNHQDDDLFAACGINKSDSSELIKEYNTIKKQLPDATKSQVVEAVIKQGSEKLVRGFIIRGIADYESSTKEMFDMLKQLFRKS
jgi:hypothetical protein